MTIVTTDTTGARADRWLVRDRARNRDLQPVPRVAACGLPCSTRVSLVKAADGGHLAGLSTCGSVHSCPSCAPIIRQDRAAELRDAIEQWQSEGGTCWLVTLTAPHHAGQSLAAGLDALMASWRDMTSGRNRVELNSSMVFNGAPFWGVVRAVDLTWSEAAGWHPHYHCVVFGPPRATQRRIRGVLVGAWLRATGNQGVQAVNAACDVRLIHRRKNSADAAAVALYGMKAAWEVHRIDLKQVGAGLAPWELLGQAIEGDQDAALLWREYSRTMKGKASSRWSHELRAWFGRIDRADEDRVGGELLDREVLGHVASSDFMPLRRIEGGAAALIFAIANGTWRELLDDLGIRYEEGPPPIRQLGLRLIGSTTAGVTSRARGAAGAVTKGAGPGRTGARRGGPGRGAPRSVQPALAIE